MAAAPKPLMRIAERSSVSLATSPGSRALWTNQGGCGKLPTISGAPRGPYCLMGVCFDCLAEIDGVPNRQSCMIAALPGMRIRRQRGARDIDPEDVPRTLPSFPIPAPRSGGA